MRLKTVKWYFGKCLVEERKHGHLCHLAYKSLTDGLIAQTSTQSHVQHSVGAIQFFFNKYPQHKQSISTMLPAPLDAKSAQMKPIITDWKNYFAKQSGVFGPNDQFSWDILRRELTDVLGGSVTGGGGGDFEFKSVLRLLSAFLK